MSTLGSGFGQRLPTVNRLPSNTGTHFDRRLTCPNWPRDDAGGIRRRRVGGLLILWFPSFSSAHSAPPMMVISNISTGENGPLPVGDGDWNACASGERAKLQTIRMQFSSPHRNIGIRNYTFKGSGPRREVCNQNLETIWIALGCFLFSQPRSGKKVTSDEPFRC